MKVIMTDDNKKPEVVVVDNADKTVAEDAMRTAAKKVTKKRVIIAVASVVVLALVIAGILVGIKFYLDSTNNVVNKTFEFLKSKDSQEKTKEDVSADTKENVVKYHRKEDDKEIWVVSDYNRDIEVMKVKTTDGLSCYVTPLNGTPSTADQFENATSPSEVVETVNTYYDLAANPIKQKSVLGKNGEELCDGVETRWMIPTCDKNDDKAVGDRSKRGICIRYYCYYRYVCYRYCYGWHCYYRCYWFRYCYRRYVYC